MSVVLSREEAAAYLCGALGLRRAHPGPGADGVRALLLERRCIQLDPLDVIGTNADLVALARVDGLARGDVYRHLLPGHAFEHFAKERCLLPAYAFPHYRDELREVRWWGHHERLRRLPEGVVGRVLDAVRERGPVTAADLEDHGRVAPMDWSGWKGTTRAASMALEVLWARCDVVVCGRRGTAKLFDVPERALPDVARAPASDFGRWAVEERVAAAGLLTRAGGPQWSLLDEVRASGLVDEMIREGRLVEVTLEGSRRPYLAPAGFRERTFPDDDGRMRVLGPLDPLLWDRGLVRHAFGFEYVWEVYKPESARTWGWYVCPLLHRGRLVGRLEGRVEAAPRNAARAGSRRGAVLRITRIWREKGAAFDEDALDAALARHAAACGASRVVRPRRRGGVG